MPVSSNYNTSFIDVTGKNETTTKLAHVLIHKIATFYLIYAEKFWV